MPYAVYIEGWSYLASGESKEDAINDLASKFGVGSDGEGLLDLSTDCPEFRQCTDQAAEDIREQSIQSTLWMNQRGVICSYSELKG
jgi:hypothetical protein